MKQTLHSLLFALLFTLVIVSIGHEHSSDAAARPANARAQAHHQLAHAGCDTATPHRHAEPREQSEHAARRVGAILFLATFISVALSASAALAQTEPPATPAATPPPALEAAASTPAPASAPAKKKEKHGISISIGDDPANADDDAKSKLTPEQLFEIELARAKNGGRDNLAEILVPSAFFLMILAIVAITVWARFRRSRMLHETVRLFADRGQALPPEVFAGTPLPPRPKSDLRRGIFWSAVGLGLIGYFLADHDSSWGTGFIPLFIGIGYLVAWKLESPPKTGAGV